MKKNMRFILTILLIIFPMRISTPLFSEITMKSSVISNGGVMNSVGTDDLVYSATVGESVIGKSENSSDDTALYSGFWYTYFLGGTSDINEEEILPFKYELSQNYPNPFNPSTTINYELKEANVVTLAIYNIRGELVDNIINGRMMQEGEHTSSFNGSRLSSGYYFYKISVGLNGQDFTKVKKMIMVK